MWLIIEGSDITWHNGRLINLMFTHHDCFTIKIHKPMKGQVMIRPTFDLASSGLILLLFYKSQQI